MERYCALKIVPENGKGYIEMKGIRSYMSLAETHLGLVPVEAIGRIHGQCYYYTMPLADDVQGKAVVREADEYEPMTLHRYRELHRPLPIDRILGVALHLLPSMYALHEAGLVHRDVKPANVVLVRGTWKLCDMGLTERRDKIVVNSGTRFFMPPEGVKDRRADLYAFGKTLFLLATDVECRQELSLLNQQFQDFMEGRLTVPGNDDRRDALQGIIQKACQHDSCHRHQTALEMHEAIKRLVRPTKMTIVLNDDYASFTPDKLEEFVSAVREKGFNIRGIPKCEEGSVRITLELMPDEAERLAAAVRAGEFSRFRAVAVEFASVQWDEFTVSHSSDEAPMLVIARKLGEGIVIGNDIYITVVAVEGNKVRLGFRVPSSVSVLKQELCPRGGMNVTEAAVEYRVNPDRQEPDERGQELTPPG
jgi:carbon storage regulator CsrA